MREKFNIILDAIRSPKYAPLLETGAGVNDAGERDGEGCIRV